MVLMGLSTSLRSMFSLIRFLKAPISMAFMDREALCEGGRGEFGSSRSNVSGVILLRDNALRCPTFDLSGEADREAFL